MIKDIIINYKFMNKVQHFDFPVSDEEKAKHFFEHIFGWKITDIPMGDMTYHMFSTGSVDDNGRGNEPNVIGGGFYKRSGPEDKGVVYATVDSIDETIKAVEAHGGKQTMPKTEIPGMGYNAKVTDPDGNEFGLWEEKPA